MPLAFRSRSPGRANQPLAVRRPQSEEGHSEAAINAIFSAY